MDSTLKKQIEKTNANYRKAVLFLEKIDCHFCEHAIFKGVYPNSQLVGWIGKNFDVTSIEWKPIFEASFNLHQSQRSV